MLTHIHKTRSRPHTLVVIVVQKFLGSDHVEKLKHSAAFDFVCGLRSKTANCGDANVEVCDLCGTDAGFADLDLLATDIHTVESVKRCWIGDSGILIFGKSNTL
jgi:hypothetical protein